MEAAIPPTFAKALLALKSFPWFPDFVLIGAVASWAYLEARTTKDLDVVIATQGGGVADPEWLSVLQKTEQEGFVYDGECFVIEGIRVHILPTTTGPIYEDSFVTAREETVGGTSIKVADPEHLILLALVRMRPVDLGRIGGLLPVADQQKLAQLLNRFDPTGQMQQSLEKVQDLNTLSDPGPYDNPFYESKRLYHEANAALPFVEKVSDSFYYVGASNDYLDWSGWEGAHRFVTDGKEILTDPETEPINEEVWAHHPELTTKFFSLYPDAKGIASGWTVPTADGMGIGIWAPGAGHGDKHEPGLHEIIAIIEKEFGKPAHLITNEEHLADPKQYQPSDDLGGWQTISNEQRKPS